MIWVELIILLACIVIGARLGGFALGATAGIGLIIFVFVLGAPPGGPPAAVLGMIIAVITALATTITPENAAAELAKTCTRPRALSRVLKAPNDPWKDLQVGLAPNWERTCPNSLEALPDGLSSPTP